jgi:two-component system nitrogen regulation sensor histidine kinase NtrY
VGDIGTMVKEFSDFARMPEAVMKPVDLRAVLNDVIALNQQAHPGLIFQREGLLTTQDELITLCDEQQIRQAFTNILQNAIDATHERIRKDGDRCEPGRISVRLSLLDNRDFVIILNDNGIGFPKGHLPESLTEPYVTFKEKGTGLGLAIVKKIMEDHKGRIEFGVGPAVSELDNWIDLGGATVSLVIPLKLA